MTWLVEGVGSIGGRVICAWIGGVLLTLGSFNHVIVVTLELIFGIRAGADVGALDVLQNFGIAAAGNMIGGLLFVTLTRTGQAIGSSDGEGPTEDERPDRRRPRREGLAASPSRAAGCSSHAAASPEPCSSRSSELLLAQVVELDEGQSLGRRSERQQQLAAGPPPALDLDDGGVGHVDLEQARSRRSRAPCAHLRVVARELARGAA